MSTNDEMRAYLNYLVRHQQECSLENCPECQMAQHIYDFTQSMIFSIVTYPEVALPVGGRARAVSATGTGRKASRRAA
jgi:ribosomal protein S27E